MKNLGRRPALCAQSLLSSVGQPRDRPIGSGMGTPPKGYWDGHPAKGLKACSKLLLVIPGPAEGRSPESTTPHFPINPDGRHGFRTAARRSAIADLRIVECRSRVNPRSVRRPGMTAMIAGVLARRDIRVRQGSPSISAVRRIRAGSLRVAPVMPAHGLIKVLAVAQRVELHGGIRHFIGKAAFEINGRRG
jgi:hypothetical protein